MAVTAAALATGIIWGMPTWGKGWVWDARTVSTLVLLLLFFGLQALRQAIAHPERAALAVSLLAVVGVVNIPIIKYSVEWFTTLHQPPSIEIGKRPTIASVYLWPLARERPRLLLLRRWRCHRGVARTDCRTRSQRRMLRSWLAKQER